MRVSRVWWRHHKRKGLFKWVFVVLVFVTKRNTAFPWVGGVPPPPKNPKNSISPTESVYTRGGISRQDSDPSWEGQKVLKLVTSLAPLPSQTKNAGPLLCLLGQCMRTTDQSVCQEGCSSADRLKRMPQLSSPQGLECQNENCTCSLTDYRNQGKVSALPQIKYSSAVAVFFICFNNPMSQIPTSEQATGTFSNPEGRRLGKPFL